MGFPRQVNISAAPAVAGDFCDSNPRAAVNAGAGAFVAGPNGLGVGFFAWADPTNTQLSNSGHGAPTGFVRRDQQGLIMQYLADSTLALLPGAPAMAFNAGGFWVQNAGAGASAIGMTAYANNANGSVSFNTPGNPPTAASVTAQLFANQVAGATLAANSITAGSVTGTTLAVTAIGAGTVLAAGQILSGGSAATGTVDNNTSIVAQVSGTPGGVGIYTVSIAQQVTSTALTVSGGGMTVSAMGSGTVAVGQTATAAANLSAGTTVTAVGTGTGVGSGPNAGSYALSLPPSTAGSGIAVSLSGGTLTVTTVASGGLSVGDTISGGSIAPGTYITAIAAGSGNYLVNTAAPSASSTVTVAAATATGWVAASIGAPGELVKMTSWGGN